MTTTRLRPREAADRRSGERGRSRRPCKTLPPLDQIKLDLLRIDQLREAIRANLVSFPTPVPTFEKHDRPDVQWKLVQLYFILGWNCDAIGARYGLIRQRVRQILTTWKRRAVEMGFIQYIPPVERLIVVPLRPPATLPTFGFLSTSPLPGPDATSLVSDVSAAH